VAAEVVVSGVALHSGLKSKVRLHPEEGGVQFLLGGKRVPARLEHVVDTRRCTVLGMDAGQVAVVEHLLAALHMRGWWEGLTVEVSAEELPILDGSAIKWCEALDALGAPPPPPPALQMREPFLWREGEGSVSVSPGHRRLCVHVDYAHPAIGEQHWCGGPKDFAALAGARTFGFLSELEILRAHGLALGASLDNVVAFAEQAPLQPLRFKDEPVRHKALDALGDFYLLGRPLHAALSISKASHHIHVQAMREIVARGLVIGARP
jgi:UDP-3-O-[3-hydroxymyristoyl] N-acetylglucosamine deacetylase